EYGDSVAPPRATDAPVRVEPSPRVEPPAFVAPPSRVEPPAYVAPAFVEPPRISAPVFADASPYGEAAPLEPPMTTRSEQATRTPSLPEPAFVAPASDVEPSSTGYVDAAELDVIELDEAELIQSAPPEPSMSDRAPTPAPEPSEPGNMFDRPTRLSDPTSLYADAEIVEDEPYDPETLPPARDLAPLASGEPTYDLGRDEAPASERKPRDAARPIDDALPGIADDEEPPESGEVESQRYPTIARESARAPLSDSPDAPTPIPPPPDDTAEVRALGSVDVVDRPAIVSAQPVYVVAERQRVTRTFGDLLDDALSLGS
ncbi:MAG TPA: hypothetical protein VL400_27900, partial [Polyangiaceae bacterium]|nr:hypothetical protein [Polyangiaceae bacterium]